MKLPRRQFLQLTGAAIAVPAVGRISPVAAESAPRQVETLAIKREEIQQTGNHFKGAFFGESNDDQADQQRGRSLLWRVRGEPRDIAWQLTEVSVAVFQRPSPSIARIAPLDITFRCTIWGRGYDSLMSKSGGCFLEVVLLNKGGLTLNRTALRLPGFDIRCQFRGSNVILLLPSPYMPVDNAVFDEISYIQLFDRGASAYPELPYIRADQCTGG
jgi:hypothetical protein